MSCCNSCNVVGSGCGVCPIAKSGGARPTMMIVGSPPLIVTTGAPGARGEVAAYVNRVDAFLRALSVAVNDWRDKRKISFDWTTLTSSGGTPDELAFLQHYGQLLLAFEGWKKQLAGYFGSGIDFLGPSPAEAWQKTQVFETDAKAARKQLLSMPDSAGLAVPPDPGALENAGGVDNSLGTTVKSLISTPLVVGGVIVAGAIAFAVLKR